MLKLTPEMVKMVCCHRTSYNPETAALMLDNQLEDTMWTLKDHLPELNRGVRRILDIGCGMGGIDIKLFKNYEGRAEIVLLDRDGIESDKPLGKYHRDASEFGSSGCLSLAKRFLQDNGVPAKAITTCDINREKFPSVKFDVIISLLSLGFHYPVETYAAQIKRALKYHRGVCILDIRKEHRADAEAALGAGEVIFEGAKHFRMIWKG